MTAAAARARAPRRTRVIRVVGGGLFAVVVMASVMVLALMRSSLGRMSAKAMPSRAALLPARAPQHGSERQFMSTDSFPLVGTQLVVRSRGSVVLLHGLGETDSLFTQWADALAAATDMNVIGLNLRGNGRSRDTVAHRGGAHGYATDVAAVIRELKRRNPSGPVLLLATHGGLGIAGHFIASAGRLDAPLANGVIALDQGFGDEARVANGRSVLVYPLRMRVASVLQAVGIPWFAGTVVAEQSAHASLHGTQWTFADWEASTPHLERVLAPTTANGTPLLVVSRAAAPGPAARAASPPTWVQVSGAVDPNNASVADAITRWAATYAADAFAPVPPRATQTLDVLGRR